MLYYSTQVSTVRNANSQDVHLSPLAEFTRIPNADPADVKASILQTDGTYHQVWKGTVGHLRV